MKRPVPFSRKQIPEEESKPFLSTNEIISILVSMLSLVFAFHMFRVSDSGIIFGVVIGVLFHEMVHKFVAQSMGFESRYKLWEIGVVLVIAFAIITRGRMIFAAPGFVVTDGAATKREQGIISLSAPSANIFLALVFFIIGGTFAMSVAYINTLLAIFNLLPVPPLDGSKVFEWDEGIWGVAFVFSLLLGAVFLL